MTSLAPPTPLTEPQWQQVQQLLQTLDARQTLWLSGYLAAEPKPQSSAAQIESSTGSLLLAHGGETGNSQSLALQLAEQCRAVGLAVEVADLARLRVRQLARYQTLLLVCSTHGDGDPPEPVVPFFEALMADNAPRLESLSYAVLALGDSSYEHFCTAGHQLDVRLEALGARRLLACQECDVDFAEPAAVWRQAVLDTLPRSVATSSETLPANDPAPVVETVDKHHPLAMEVLENVCLSAPERADAIHHLELALPPGVFSVSPGDAVAILPDNPPHLVAAVLNACGLSGEAAVSVAGTPMPLVQALRQHLDLTVPGNRFLGFWAQVSNHSELQQLAAAAAPEQRQFLRRSQLLDLLQLAPATPEPQALVDALRPLQPRLYDVANSLDELPDELHLTVRLYRYPFANRTEDGIATRYLLGLAPGDQVRLYPHRNNRFHLPLEPELPLIFIAEGTGIAPCRAFVQALARQGHQGRAWLVFAEQCFEQDFLYQSEWQQAHADGVLAAVDTVFSADQPGATLASPLLAQQQQLNEWIARGAHLYFCGDKDLLTDCEKTLEAALGAELWKPLVKDKRVHRNLY